MARGLVVHVRQLSLSRIHRREHGEETVREHAEGWMAPHSKQGMGLPEVRTRFSVLMRNRGAGHQVGARDARVKVRFLRLLQSVCCDCTELRVFVASPEGNPTEHSSRDRDKKYRGVLGAAAETAGSHPTKLGSGSG